MKRQSWGLLFVILVLTQGCSLLSGPQTARRRDAMLAAGEQALCRVHYYFSRPEDEVADTSRSVPWRMRSDSAYQRYIDQQSSLLTVGLLLDNEGHVLVGDLHLDDRWIDRIEVVAPDGTVYPARRQKLLGRFEGVLLRLERPLKNWQAPQFVDREQIGPDESAYVVSLRQTGKQWWVDITPTGQSHAYAREKEQPSRIRTTHGGPSGPLDVAQIYFQMAGAVGRASDARPGLLCDAQGRPIGAATANGLLDPTQQVEDWQRERLLSGPGLTFEQIDALRKRCQQEFGRNVYACKLLYRHEAEEPAGGDMPFLPPSLVRQLMGGQGDQKEWETFAVAVGPKRLMVPLPISKEQAARIEEIQLTVAGQVRQAEFVGAYREMGAFLVELKEGTLSSAAQIVGRPRPEPLRLFLTVTPEKKMGATHLRVRPNRWVWQRRGYKDQYYISPSEPVSQGTWILDTDLNVLGVYTRQRIQGEEIKQFSSDDMGMVISSLTGEGTAHIFWAADLEPMLQEPVAHFDPQIRHKTEQEAKRLVWLGVESSAVTPELAKQLNIEKETKDGSIGLLVTRVYAGSPAEKMGILNGDVLLRVHTSKRPEPIELKADRESSFYSRFSWMSSMPYEAMEEYGGTTRRWPVRRNYLTMLLQSIGEGETVSLDYLHQGEPVSKDYTIELAPQDFASANKYKNNEIGLTVKDITYEVRAALRLEQDKQAVVVAKVERGSPAEVANIQPFELITSIDGKPVGSAEAFEKTIKSAIGEGKTSVRLGIEYLGKSRLADLDLKQLGD